MKPGKTIWDFACEHPIIFAMIVSGLTTATVAAVQEIAKSIQIKEN